MPHPLPTTHHRALLALALAGLLLPWWHYLPWFADGGAAAVHGFWHAATANPVATGITLDVYLAAVSFALWVLHERRVRRPWLYVLGCFAIGLAVVLPLYLVQRARGDKLSR
ncbi:MAG TPA: DUF2834 domain-containing protein [Aquabacterium sp.]|nr:DUF2834 domain-containing protein [Aquabacterium sp.]HQC99755.1 DUF2834 domain-containing protein [Aquabacterium sp.]